MTTNMGKIDRILRLAVAAALFFYAFAGGFAAMGALQWVAAAVAAVFAITALVGNCPAYSIVGIKTCRTS